jgi:6-pyruvoyltetrahydropterin/6-carboxytetrahydropterin synthase
MGLINFPFFHEKDKPRGYFLTSEIKFDAAHRLSNYDGKCSRLHGHTYRVVVTVGSEKLNNWGAVMDFGDLKEIFKTHIDAKFDHKTILFDEDEDNQRISRAMGKDWVCWMSCNPTAENMAREIYKDIKAVFNSNAKFKGVKLESVTVYETPTNEATYWELK